MNQFIASLLSNFSIVGDAKRSALFAMRMAIKAAPFLQAARRLKVICLGGWGRHTLPIVQIITAQISSISRAIFCPAIKPNRSDATLPINGVFF